MAFLNHILMLCVMLMVTRIEGMAKWHTLQNRLDLKKEAEKTYSPTEKIMINQLWDLNTLMKQEKNKYFPLVEVDMDLTKEQKRRYSVFGFYFHNTSPHLADPWPKAEIRYRFSTSEPVNDKTVFTQAMESWTNRVSCIKFIEDKTSSEGKVLLIVQRKLSFASVGYRPERSQHYLSVSEVAQTKPVLIHLLGHVLGLPHSHSRPDRDRFLVWMRENVELQDILYLNTKQDCPYDFSSVMHYDQFAFTMNRNGEMSFFPKSQDWSDDPSVNSVVAADEEMSTFIMNLIVGRWKAPSPTDVFRVETAYDSVSGGNCWPSETDCLPMAQKYELIKVLPLQISMYSSNDYLTSLTLRGTENKEDHIWTFNPNDIQDNYSYDGMSLEDISDNPCKRQLWMLQVAQEPTIGELGFWLLTGCTFVQFEMYDYFWDHHTVYCAAQFARKYRKVIFSSSSAVLHLRMHKLDHREVKKMKNGVIKLYDYVDYICQGKAIAPSCMDLVDPKGPSILLPE